MTSSAEVTKASGPTSTTGAGDGPLDLGGDRPVSGHAPGGAGVSHRMVEHEDLWEPVVGSNTRVATGQVLAQDRGIDLGLPISPGLIEPVGPRPRRISGAGHWRRSRGLVCA